MLGVPFDLLLSTDAYYFALLPIVDQVRLAFGVPSLSTAYAMIIGNIIGTFVSPLSPALWLALGFAGLEMGTHPLFLHDDVGAQCCSFGNRCCNWSYYLLNLNLKPTFFIWESWFFVGNKKDSSCEITFPYLEWYTCEKEQLYIK